MSRVRRGCVTGLLAVCAPLASAFAADFKATVNLRTPGKLESFPISVKGSKYRLERTIDGDAVVIIVDPQQRAIQSLVPRQRILIPVRLGSFESAFLDPLQSVIEGTAATPGEETRLLGTQLVHGFLCRKFGIVAKDTPKSEAAPQALLTYFVAEKLSFIIRIEYGNFTGGAKPPDRVTEVVDIREGPVEETAVQVPAGYTRMETPAPPPGDRSK